ncbi:metallophosphoesterase [Teredinibacter sp. KSP-S5-2]|uniref:metallophosphoesterase n=1 Tax=Teredinibacter sp. KSP-S5-2 TaxID=3034506 RepID=UPI002934B334|nr:metallophosphoesterase [Teredinibacter sp. KSP-S5-2]WNO11147.1 metallophosphoesterase [Teredinibacter sp. KSP-S5-2]
MRLFAFSDIHIDYQSNLRWLQQISNSEYVNDCVILAGDVSDSLSLLEECFYQLSKKFNRIFFVPGNHDLWVLKGEADHSIDKFQKVIALADQYQVRTRRERVGQTDILPLYAWYDMSFGQPCNNLYQSWMDFRACKWPEELNCHNKITEFFLEQNCDYLMPSAVDVISFSHFLPRLDIMPSFIPKKHRMVYPVLGCERLDAQLRRAGSKIHIYGHSHVNRNVTIGGVRYINSAYGYPAETSISTRSLFCVKDSI